jgi:hypothetical protein
LQQKLDDREEILAKARERYHQQLTSLQQKLEAGGHGDIAESPEEV